jgi:hypothetical protein
MTHIVNATANIFAGPGVVDVHKDWKFGLEKFFDIWNSRSRELKSSTGMRTFAW